MVGFSLRSHRDVAGPLVVNMPVCGAVGRLRANGSMLEDGFKSLCGSLHSLWGLGACVILLMDKSIPYTAVHMLAHCWVNRFPALINRGRIPKWHLPALVLSFYNELPKIPAINILACILFLILRTIPSNKL